MSSPKKSPQPAKWAETMKTALAKKKTGGGPAQPKPRDSGIKKVKKDAF